MRFSEGDSKLQSQRASCRQAQTRRRFTDTPVAWVKFHMRERIERLERRLLLSTQIEGLEERHLVLKTYPPVMLFSAPASHDILWRKYLFWITKKANQYKFWHFLSRGVIDWFFWTLFYIAALHMTRCYDDKTFWKNTCWIVEKRKTQRGPG